MLNWIKFLSVFLAALAATITIIVFYQAEKPYAAVKNASVEFVAREKELAEIEFANVYHGAETYISVFGTDAKGKKKAVIVDEKAEKIIRTVTLSKGISRDRAIDLVKKDAKVDQILHASLGIENDEIIWEVAFTGPNEELNYVYILFENGQWSKRIMNL